MDQLLVNLKLMGWIQNDLSRLGEYCSGCLEGLRLGHPYNYPSLVAMPFAQRRAYMPQR